MVRVAESDTSVVLKQGDLIIIPHGATHDLYCGLSSQPDVLPLDQVLAESKYTGEGVLVHGGPDTDSETQLICGHFSFGENTRHIIYENLPESIIIKDYGAEAGPWMEANLRMIGREVVSNRIGSDIIAIKMSEVIFTQALRTFIERDGEKYRGFAAFADVNLARAITAFHHQPADEWTVEDLAREAGLSRTKFAQSFSEKMGITPLKYLTSWRMQLACQALMEDGINVIEAADRVGYASESAFIKVFKREIGMTPAIFRNNIC